MFFFFFSQRILSQKWREKKRRKSSRHTSTPRRVKERVSSKVLFKKVKSAKRVALFAPKGTTTEV